MEDNEQAKLEKERNTIYIPTKFGFLLQTSGLRPGCLTGLLSTSSAGKTTLVRSIAVETAKDGIVFNWSTEETPKEYKLGLARQSLSESVLNNIKIFSETTITDKKKDSISAKDFLDVMEDKILTTRPTLIICDNLTTSIIYEDKHNDQPYIVTRLRKIAKNAQCPLLAVLHTGGLITDATSGLIDRSHVRGTKHIANKSDYFYIMQVFKGDSRVYPIMKIDKHRFHPDVDKKWFFLKYSKELNAYTGDEPISFNEMKDYFKKRDKL